MPILVYVCKRIMYPALYAEFSLPKYTYSSFATPPTTSDRTTVSVSLPKFATTRYDSRPGNDLYAEKSGEIKFAHRVRPRDSIAYLLIMYTLSVTLYDWRSPCFSVSVLRSRDMLL